MELVGQLAGGVAHEFNNLLQAIRGYADYALEGLDPAEPRAGDLRQIVKAADRAAAITRQLLGFSRRRVLEQRHVDPNRVVAELADMIRPLIGEHIRLETVLGEDAGTAWADAGELQQALLNLCLNARDAMPGGGNLVVSTSKAVIGDGSSPADARLPPGRCIVITVADSGCGMSAETQQRLFEPFYTTKEVGKGTGLGLATVYGIVRQHGGAIQVESELGRGTTFRIYLPADDTPQEVPAVVEDATACGGSETILLAEDEPMVRSLAVRILEQAGYSVLTADNGAEALQLYRNHHSQIDLVLLDAIMPRLHGREVCRRIKTDHPEAKVLFCSGYDSGTVLGEDPTDQECRLIAKPFDSVSLLQAVREMLDADVACLAGT